MFIWFFGYFEVGIIGGAVCCVLDSFVANFISIEVDVPRL